MKTRLLFLALFTTYILLGQNWSQVGNAKFTNFSTDAAMALNPTTGNPYVIYTDATDNNKPYVSKFDGTNWVSVGANAIIPNEARLINIAFDPSTKEPNVVFKNMTTNSLDVYKFDGTNWVAIQTNAFGSGNLLEDKRLSIKYDSNNFIYVFGYKTSAGNFANNSTNRDLLRFADYGAINNNTSSWSFATEKTVGSFKNIKTFNTYFTPPFKADTRFVQNASLTLEEFPRGNIVYSKFLPETRPEKFTIAKNSDYYAILNEGLGNRTEKKIIFGFKDQDLIQPPNTSNYTNTVLKLAEDKTEDNVYLMYADVNQNLKLQKYSNQVWNSLPETNISATSATFFSQLEFNTINNNLYLMYLDGGKISVQSYSNAPVLTKYYVNANVSGGNGSGDSWANAMTDLNNAIAASGATTKEIWVAKGIYNPRADSRLNTFSLEIDDLKIYGGFNGTETTIAGRNLVNNRTILSGDLNKDDLGVGNSGNNRAENSLKVVTIKANNIVVDGFEISGGQANGTTSANNSGAGIFVNATSENLTIKNCDLRNNYAKEGAALMANFNVNTDLNISNTRFRNNSSNYGASIYTLIANNRVLNVNITNCLFNGNSTTEHSGSSAWIRANGSNSNVTTTVTNCTFSDNKDLGSISTYGIGTLALGKRVDGSSSHTATINNSIFYHNKGANASITNAIGSGSDVITTNVFVNNSIGENNFANLSFLTNTNNSDPLFVDVSKSIFGLSAGSPALNGGDNSKIKATNTKDLLGKDRIQNTTVDIGAFEGVYTPVFYALNVIAENGTVVVSPEPNNGTYLENTEVTLTATASAGFKFSGWSGDTNKIGNSITTIVDKNKTINAIFIADVVYVDADATGNNSGEDWLNAYTDLNNALKDNLQETFWVAEGKYNPGTLAQNNFTLTNNQTVLGGFNGTEINLNQRNIKLNKTILTGDITGDDNGVLDLNSTYANNNRNVIFTNGTNIIIDGITISGGGTAGTGSAIFINNNTSTFTAKNVTFFDNRTSTFGIIYSSPNSNTLSEDYNYSFENCIFENNVGNGTTIMYLNNPALGGNRKLNISITNSLFFNNKTRSNNNFFRFRHFNSQEVNFSLINNTISENIFESTSTNTTQEAFIANEMQNSNSRVLINVFNTIFWNNKLPNSSEIDFIKTTGNRGTKVITASNSLDANDFVGATSKTNNLILDPLFTDASNGDFSLKATSPAIDAGNNSFLPNNITEDLEGETRVFSLAVDMGAYESKFVGDVKRTLTITATNGTVSTNPSPVNGTYDDGTVVTLTATPNAGFALVNWTIDGATLANSTTGPATSITITMDADKTVAAIFDATASINDELINSFKLYPNPTNNVLHISTDLEIKNCKVYNVIGKEVLESKSKEIKVSNLPKGMYLIQIITAKGKSVTKKFVKK